MTRGNLNPVLYERTGQRDNRSILLGIEDRQPHASSANPNSLSMIPTPETWSFETSRIGRRVLGVPPPDEELDPNDPRRLVAEALGYLTNNRERMDYPRYRKLRLPITSSLVEALVGRKAA